MDYRNSRTAEDLVASMRALATGGLASETDLAAFLRSAAASGLTGLTLPATCGGGQRSLLDSVVAMEALAEAGVDPGYLFSLGVHIFAIAGPMLGFATPDQQRAWLPGLASGRVLGAFATSELGAGSDAFTITTTARETSDGYVLSGEKVWVTNAPIANVFLVSARTDDIPGAFGVSCLLVPRETPGVSVVNGPPKVGLAGAPWGTLQLDGAHVPASHLLGSRGAAAMVFQEAMRWERCGLFAIPIGATQRGLARTIERLAARTQFGAPLIENAVVARSIALAKSRIEAARLLLYKAAASVDAGQADDLAISLAKSFASEAALETALELQKLSGAAGVLRDEPPARLVEDMLPFRVLSGANDVHYQIIARLLRAAS